MSENVRFIRVNGRIVPVKGKAGEGKPKKAKGRNVRVTGADRLQARVAHANPGKSVAMSNQSKLKLTGAARKEISSQAAQAGKAKTRSKIFAGAGLGATLGSVFMRDKRIAGVVGAYGLSAALGGTVSALIAGRQQKKLSKAKGEASRDITELKKRNPSALIVIKRKKT